MSIARVGHTRVPCVFWEHTRQPRMYHTCTYVRSTYYVRTYRYVRTYVHVYCQYHAWYLVHLTRTIKRNRRNRAVRIPSSPPLDSSSSTGTCVCRHAPFLLHSLLHALLQSSTFLLPPCSVCKVMQYKTMWTTRPCVTFRHLRRTSRPAQRAFDPLKTARALCPSI